MNDEKDERECQALIDEIEELVSFSSCRCPVCTMVRDQALDIKTALEVSLDVVVEYRQSSEINQATLSSIQSTIKALTSTSQTMIINLGQLMNAAHEAYDVVSQQSMIGAIQQIKSILTDQNIDLKLGQLSPDGTVIPIGDTDPSAMN